MVKISPSILSADFANLGESIKQIDKHGADWVHIDVMDGSFVPNISFGFPVIKAIKSYTKLPFDVHLMIDEPSKYVKEFVDCGADIITIHVESEKHIDRAISYIKSFGIKVGIAINPGTPVSMIKDLIPMVDMVLIMSVNPGFGGQSYIDYCSSKIREVRGIAKEVNEELLIQVDGGVSSKNIKHVVECGANVIVAGSAVFKNGEIEKNIKELKDSI